MLKIIATTVVAAFFATSALAADLPLRAGPAAVALAPAYNWTGWYVGVEGGGGFGYAWQNDPFFNAIYKTHGGVVGGTLGYNSQFNVGWGLIKRLVVGLEVDESYADIRGSRSLGCGGAAPECSSHLRSLGTLRGRLGLAGLRWWPTVFPYITGGLAWGTLHGSEGDFVANGPVGSGSATRTGWTAGGGVEALVAPHLSAKVEWLYVDLGNHAVFTDLFPGGAFVTQNIKWHAEIVRGGLNYKF
jgi:outer membrane immunogenic protein